MSLVLGWEGSGPVSGRVSTLNFELLSSQALRLQRHPPAMAQEHQQFQKKKMQGKKSEEVDGYVEDAPLFAKPILNRIRKAFHFGCPDLEETMKWGAPHFEYKGILGAMSAHKEHVTMSFWKGQLMDDPEGIFNVVGQTQMSAIKFKALKDMPPQQILIDYVGKAAELNEQGVKALRKTAKVREKLTIPDDLLDALGKNGKARKTFDELSYSHKKEYVEWLEEAKKVSTRRKRLATAIEWMAEGKPRNWKYMKK